MGAVVLVGVGSTRVGIAVGVETGARVGVGDCVFAVRHAHRLQAEKLANTRAGNNFRGFMALPSLLRISFLQKLPQPRIKCVRTFVPEMAALVDHNIVHSGMDQRIPDCLSHLQAERVVAADHQ